MLGLLKYKMYVTSAFHYFLTSSWHLDILFNLFLLLCKRLWAFCSCFNLRWNSFINWESIYWVPHCANLLYLGYTKMSKTRYPVLDSLHLSSSWFDQRDRFISRYLSHNIVSATVVLSSSRYLEIIYPVNSLPEGTVGSFFSHDIQKGKKTFEIFRNTSPV